MKLKELRDLINYHLSQDPSLGENEVVVLLETNDENQVGLASEKVKDLDFGMDWDNGKCFLIPENKLTTYKKKG